MNRLEKITCNDQTEEVQAMALAIEENTRGLRSGIYQLLPRLLCRSAGKRVERLSSEVGTLTPQEINLIGHYNIDERYYPFLRRLKEEQKSIDENLLQKLHQDALPFLEILEAEELLSFMEREKTNVLDALIETLPIGLQNLIKHAIPEGIGAIRFALNPEVLTELPDDENQFALFLLLLLHRGKGIVGLASFIEERFSEKLQIKKTNSKEGEQELTAIRNVLLAAIRNQYLSELPTMTIDHA